VDLSRQKAEVDAVLREVTQRHRADLALLERQAPSLGPDDEDARLDALTNANAQARAAILAPLADRGNAEAMARLADSALRESDAPADVERWFALVSCAADLGHPFALDEMTRWYWHQRGDGSIAQIQANRARALVFADRAALAGNLFAISRIATYIAGDVHQYPANLRLAQRLLRLCARTGASTCADQLAGEWVYDPGLGPVDAGAWLAVMADCQPERFAKRREVAWAMLTAQQRSSAAEAAKAWRPTPWRDLQPEWKALQAEILAYGQTSTGALLSCGTSRPWCRTVHGRASGEGGAGE
jgi:hypothetical protein